MTICITGIGVISSIGMNVGENFSALRNRCAGMARATLFDSHHGGCVSEVKCPDGELKKQLGIPQKKVISRTALLGMFAASEALTDAGISGISDLRIGLISSTSVGGMDRTERFYSIFRENGTAGRMREVVMHDCGASTECIASYLHIDGFVTTVSTACSSAANAIMLGARMIRQGLLDAVVVGGTDALCKFTLNGFASLMILDKEPCRPFDENRAGLNLGEGAGYLVLQSEQSCVREAYGVVAGFANANDAYHQTASSPEGDGPYRAMYEALQRSGLKPAEVDYINVHGTGTPNNDGSEGRAMKRLFGEKVPAFSSTKAYTGHTLGAAGGIEAVFSVMAMDRGVIFPNLNFLTPMSDLQLIPETEFREGVGIQVVMSNSFGFGGNNTSLIFKKYR